MRSLRYGQVSLGLVLSTLTPAWAQETAAQAMRQSFTTQLFFWTTAFVLMAFMGRFVFREQLAERRTIRRLTDEIGPFFPEFEIPAIKRWVDLCAPHVWSAWSGGSIAAIADFITSDFSSNPGEKETTTPGLSVEASLNAVIKVHPLLVLKGDGTLPPDGVELLLRVEQRGTYCLRKADGTVVDGSPKSRQIHHFWTLVHDGRGWRLHTVKPADDDLKNFPIGRDLPHVTEWRDPEG